ncbi:OLC1v1027188C1 [Oldenlandia corymbosa var. corymbosa]|uniref:OLC1v1027188C1 n=1 Tax=Oldenlandia corymbosa var. corymbosa TaxID=529605 RepID=A0AAV1C9D4_OLDCO|nr:OLC1v1027188C1 [Oldenlandia corymbosa var. corymbosa]
MRGTPNPRLDQGLSENYSCPTCRKPLFLGRHEHEVNSRGSEISGDEQLARQISAGLNRANLPGQGLATGIFPEQTQNTAEVGDWRGAVVDSSWLGFDGAGPSNGGRSAGLGRVQMMMRHLAAVGETYAQTALEDSNWSLWPMNPSQAGTSRSAVPSSSARFPGTAGGVQMRTATRAVNENLANILAMAETVREVLPHVPDEIIIQDLQRTNSAMVTLNNLLQM